MLFPDEMRNVTFRLFESQICIQNAVEYWETNPQIAQADITCAVENTEKTAKAAWLLIAEVFTMFLIIPTAIMVISLVFIKRYEAKPKAY